MLIGTTLIGIKKIKVMSKNKHQCPWGLAYEQNKDRYTKEQIDEMLLCEIQELIYQEND